MVTKPQNNSSAENEAMEEVLQLLRQQSALLSNPEKMLPIEYMEYVQRKMDDRNRDLSSDYDMMTEEILHYIENVLKNIGMFPDHAFSYEILYMLRFDELLQIIMHNTKRKNNKPIYMKIRQLEQKYQELAYSRRENLNSVHLKEKMVIE